MNELQKVILDVFKEYRSICDRHGLRYYAIGGTCIGAIRHQGFIPWDDDLDVAMPWEDYLRFREIAPLELRSPYELYDFETYKHCTQVFLKVHNTNTTFIEEEASGFVDRRTGVFIDIMPMCGLPNTEEETKEFIDECRMISKWNLAHRFSAFERKNMKNNSIGSKIFSMITFPFRLGKPFTYYSRKYETKLGSFKFGETDNVFFAWRPATWGTYKNVFPCSIFEEYLEVPFEDTVMRVPKEYDHYLSMDFGNYMELPPEEKRVSVHNTEIIDLSKPCR